MNILLVDDNLLMQQVLERFLGSLGYSVVAAARADEAIELARQHQPALILMDLHLPDRGGTETLDLIRDLPGYRHIPAIAMSGMDEQDARNIMSNEFSAFLPKPVDLDALESAVREYTVASRSHSVGAVN